MEKRKILIQLDSDPHASVFDRVVAVDAGVDELFSYSNVQPDQVRDLVYGAIFTRGGPDLARTAVFVGGRDVALGERLMDEARKAFFGPLRVSLMLDANGANTTAAAAVLAATREMNLKGAVVLVTAGTGPVGQRVARLLVRRGAKVRVASRQVEKASNVCVRIGALTGTVPDAVGIANADELAGALEGADAVFSAGAAGVVTVPKAARAAAQSLKLAIDLNAVPPLGIEGVDSSDKGVLRDGVKCWGAIGVGGLKMKIHRAAVSRLFERNDQVFDAEQIYEIGAAL